MDLENGSPIQGVRGQGYVCMFGEHLQRPTFVRGTDEYMRLSNAERGRKFRFFVSWLLIGLAVARMQSTIRTPMTPNWTRLRFCGISLSDSYGPFFLQC
jgi:hypothetical protein